MRWIKRDMEEYVETAGVKRRKMEQEIEKLKRIVDGKGDGDAEDGKGAVKNVKEEVVKKAVDSGVASKSVPNEGAPRKAPAVIW
ncbi:hypothetical protein HK104_009242 [Borealophlyctis nickersoniae]|nr:hypothetical protein HK104_009242 [Borealophlyctis nickersoniae]